MFNLHLIFHLAWKLTEILFVSPLGHLCHLVVKNHKRKERNMGGRGKNLAALNLKVTMRSGWPPIVNEQPRLNIGTMQKVTCLR